MSAHTLQVPGALVEDRVLPFFSMLRGLAPADNYVFDFCRLSWAPPFGMLLFGVLLRQFRAAHVDATFTAVNYNHHTYPAHMGFFRYFNLKFGKEPGEASGSRVYIPIRVLELDHFAHEAVQQGGSPHEAIERHSRDIARVLARQENGKLVDNLGYLFREILRNALEHSGTTHVGYCAQFWPTRHLVELAVIDTGCGVRQSLSQNPFLELRSDHDAILYALLPGISGTFYKGIPARPYDDWQNSGYGLYMASRLCGRDGVFVLISGNQGLRLRPSVSEWFDADFKGTAVRAVLRTDRVGALDQALLALGREGDATARDMNLTTFVSASRAARFLVKDFDGKGA